MMVFHKQRTKEIKTNLVYAKRYGELGFGWIQSIDYLLKETEEYGDLLESISKAIHEKDLTSDDKIDLIETYLEAYLGSKEQGLHDMD